MWFTLRLSTSLLTLAALSTVHAQATTTLASGLQIEAVSGPTACSRPTRNGDRISVHYRGSLLATGKEFDSSYGRGTPFSFTLGAQQVIQGWDDGLVDMCIGASRKLTIPPELGYGDRGAGRDIPPKATLVFETTLMAIAGVDPEEALSATSTSASAGEGAFAIATAPPTPSPTTAVEVVDDKVIVTPVEPAADGGSSSSISTADKDGEAKPQRCSLVGPFALLVQGALGGLALLTLVWKRWREHPKRPLKVFIFDVSKQILGSMLTHVINLAMSMLSSVDMANAAAHAASKVGEQVKEKYGTPNPCSFYLLNLAIDTTLGVPVLYLLLIVLTAAFMRTPLARPPQSLKSGNYGVPPNASWYGKQLMIYCIGLVGMKLFVFFLFVTLPWLPWIGDWALRWTRGNEQLEIAFALFIFPLLMNAVQYWVIDNLIMDKQKGDTGEGATYQQVDDDERDADHRQFGLEDDEDDADEDDTLVGNHPAAIAPRAKAADNEFGPDFVDQTAETVLKKDRSVAANPPA